MSLRLLLPPSAGTARARARAELLDQSLRADLTQPVTVDVARDYADLARRADGSDAHLVWLPPTLCARLETSLRGLYKCLRHGRDTYRSAIVARRGTVDRLEGVRGRRVAWVDRLSVGGYLLAVDHLRAAGIDPARELGEQRFVGSYPDAIAAVVEERADLAALSVHDDGAQAIADALASHGGRAAVDRLEAIAVSAPSPNDAIAITQALDRARAERLSRRVFGGGARARAALCLALDAEGFVRAEPGEYAELRAMLDGTT